MRIDLSMGRAPACSALAIAALAIVPASASAAGAQTGAEQARHALQRAEDLSRGIGVHTGRELTPALLELARTKRSLDPAGRTRANALLARPTSTESAPGHAYSVLAHTPLCGTHFCIHYVTSTVDAPDQTDDGGKGVPGYVDLMLNVF